MKTLILLAVVFGIFSDALLKESLEEDVDIVQERIETLAKDLKDGAANLKDKVVDAVFLAKDATEKAAKDAAGTLEEKLTAAKDWVSKEASTASDSLEAGGSAIKETVHQMAEKTAKIVHDVKEKILNEDL